MSAQLASCLCGRSTAEGVIYLKIKCDYCDTMFDDTNAQCPYCGAPNAGVLRRSGGQPVTIEELKKWYSDHRLPPYEITRFFIGEDYRKPRAFGIYKDEKTGNVVVYKNKDSGQRAIRYQGTDEAYAVNELYQRLKQEIIQQKGAQQKKAANPRQTAPAPSSKPTASGKKGPGCCLIAFLATVGFFVLLFVWATISVIVEDKPDRGYYSYGTQEYYYFVNDETTVDSDWFAYAGSETDWDGPIARDQMPEPLRKNKTAEEYFVQEEWSDDLNVPDFRQSTDYDKRMKVYRDKQTNAKVSSGYFIYGDQVYYHWKDDDNSGGWYSYDETQDDWTRVTENNVPDDLQHQSIAQDFYYVPQWDSSTQFTDFADSSAYSSLTRSSSSSNNGWRWDDDDDDDYWRWDDDDDYDYSWSSDDYSWDSGSSDWDSDW